MSMDNDENFLKNSAGAEDVVDGVMTSCFKRVEKNEDDEDIEEYQKRFNEEVVISKTRKFDEYYSMNYPRKGYLLIFAHSEFIFGNLTDRYAELDVISMTKTFSKLDFDIMPYRDCTLNEIKSIMKKVSSMNFNEYACFAIAVSSHGNFHQIASKDTNYDPAEVFYEPIKEIKTLFAKPKIFFIGACRGSKIDQGITLLSPVQTDGGHLEEYRLPKAADFLIIYATVQGYIAYSNDRVGSHFFKYLTETLIEYIDHDLLTILIFANQNMAMNFTSSSTKYRFLDDNKQCMSFMSTLTRKIKFVKK
ncbi:caspase-1-like [Coccinella septempunctata]|uniref:caspase-1-like n=1 Tax=Coccinella septempunctata TaxID=41139 RepID=UPI001D076C1A|nr:caspase-1-like [Coccinella septempunctata]